MATLFDDQWPAGAAGQPGARPPENERAPLAERMRPRTLDEVVGHQGVLGGEGFLRRAILEDRVPSLVFWGPPGSGKTTLARLIASAANRAFLPYSAVTAGIKELKEVMAEAQRLRRSGRPAALLFVDEIHRFNRAQQDAFLPFVETGDVVLVGATTENPSFELNGALLSRCRVVVLEPLSTAELVEVLERALHDQRRGLASSPVRFEAAALEQIAVLASGDARRALNLLELVAADAPRDRPVAASAVTSAAQRRVLPYDKAGDEHFALISALHKSLRESDVDASLYWLVRMLESGEDPHYLARRLLRFASEDVGLADPLALSHTLAAWQAYERLGSPEGDLALAQAAIYLALAPKSVAAYRALDATRQAVAERPAEPVPAAIRNAPTQLMARLGHGRGYVYAPDTAQGVAGLDCLPPSLRGATFYQPADSGFEAELRRRLAAFAARRAAARPP